MDNELLKTLQTIASYFTWEDICRERFVKGQGGDMTWEEYFDSAQTDLDDLISAEEDLNSVIRMARRAIAGVHTSQIVLTGEYSARLVGVQDGEPVEGEVSATDHTT